MNSIIRQFTVEAVSSGTEAESIALQRALSRIIHDRVLPVVENVLERWAPQQSHWYFERLQVDIGAIEFEHLENDLPGKIAECLERSLQDQAELLPSNLSGDFEAPRKMSVPFAAGQALLFFLANGRLPWSFPLGSGQSLETTVKANWQEVDPAAEKSDFSRTMIGLLAAYPVRFRLFSQFTRPFCETLLWRLSPGAKAKLDQVAEKLTELEASDKDKNDFTGRLIETLFEALAFQFAVTTDEVVWTCWNRIKNSLPERDRSIWLAWLTTHWPSGAEIFADADADSARPAKQKFETLGDAVGSSSTAQDRLLAGADAELGEGLFIANAGLVLLHPFLPQLFQALGVANDDRLLQPVRALVLLHYLATGQTAAPEYELVLPKLLCNIPLTEPVASQQVLSAEETQEADALLQAVIRHWAALGDASIDSLRGTFLLRPGKLSRRKDGDWLVQVESSSFDILLNRLPWGISAFKLPWMQPLIWMEWRYESEF